MNGARTEASGLRGLCELFELVIGGGEIRLTGSMRL